MIEIIGSRYSDITITSNDTNMEVIMEDDVINREKQLEEVNRICRELEKKGYEVTPAMTYAVHYAFQEGVRWEIDLVSGWLKQC